MRKALASSIALAALLSCLPAWAQDPPLPPLSSAPAPAPAPPEPAPAPSSAPSAPSASSTGVAVVGFAGLLDATWPLAQAVYADASLRPVALDEARARVLAGEGPAPGAPGELRDLAETLAAVRGDDAASRALLGDVARHLGVKALVVVRSEAGHPIARVFLADSSAFDAVTLSPDGGAALRWGGATRSLLRMFGVAPVGPASPPPPLVYSAPALATHEEPPPGPSNRPKAFYESGWFWGALSAAAFAGGAVYFATRDNSASTIHLEMQVPH